MITSISLKSKKTEHHDIVKRLYDLSHSKDQVANTVLALMVSTVELAIGTTLHVPQETLLTGSIP